MEEKMIIKILWMIVVFWYLIGAANAVRYIKYYSMSRNIVVNIWELTIITIFGPIGYFISDLTLLTCIAPVLMISLVYTLIIYNLVDGGSQWNTHKSAITQKKYSGQKP